MIPKVNDPDSERYEALTKRFWAENRPWPEVWKTPEDAKAKEAASYRLHETDVELECTLDDEARPRAVAIDGWGRPDNTEIHGLYRFEHELTRYSRFEGLTIPSAGRAAWFYGGEGSSGHDFFRYELSRFRLMT